MGCEFDIIQLATAVCMSLFPLAIIASVLACAPFGLYMQLFWNCFFSYSASLRAALSSSP
jgi:hypothetical protein